MSPVIRKPVRLPGEPIDEFAFRLWNDYETARAAYEFGIIEAVDIWGWMVSLSADEMAMVKMNIANSLSNPGEI